MKLHRSVLEQNFLRYDGLGDLPDRFKEQLFAGAKDDRALRAKARDCWYVPDPNQAGDLEEQRERALLREFEEYPVADLDEKPAT